MSWLVIRSSVVLRCIQRYRSFLLLRAGRARAARFVSYVEGSDSQQKRWCSHPTAVALLLVSSVLLLLTRGAAAAADADDNDGHEMVEMMWGMLLAECHGHVGWKRDTIE